MKANAESAYNELFSYSTVDLELAKSYIERHPDEDLDSQLTDEEIEQHDEMIGFGGNVEDILGKNETVERAAAKLLKLSMENMFDGEYGLLGKTNYSAAFIIDTDEEHIGLPIYYYNKDTGSNDTASMFGFDIKKHPLVKELIDSGSDKMIFEKMEDFPGSGKFYICYKPIIIRGQTQAVLCIAFNWDDFNDLLHFTVIKTLLICVGALTIVLILLQILIYRRATAPIGSIQEAVREYTDDKDSSNVISKMSKIKQTNEFGMLSEDISKLAKEIDFYTHETARLTGERERVAAELDMATKIQADQLPSEFPAFPDRTDFDIYATMTPAKEVGGDFYDFFFVDDDHLALVIADVSGKGVPAALFMMMSKNLIKDHAMMKLSPMDIAGQMNRMLCENNKQDMFVTAWIGILELSTGRITAVNAGHEYPAILRPDGKFELFEDDHCFVLGGMKRAVYRQYEFTLPRGSTLFLYTDGVTEATDAEDKMFGEGMLVEALNKYPDASLKELLEGVRSEIGSFAGTAPQYDDITMLGIKLM